MLILLRLYNSSIFKHMQICKYCFNTDKHGNCSSCNAGETDKTSYFYNTNLVNTSELVYKVGSGKIVQPSPVSLFCRHVSKTIEGDLKT